MNRSELINTISTQLKDIPSKDVDLGVRLIIEAMKVAMVRGHRIEIRNFGVFYIKSLSGALYRNPRTGDYVSGKYRKSIKFKMGKSLFEELQRKVKSDPSRPRVER